MKRDPIETVVLECLRENYGVEGRLERLPGENLNYLVTASRGERFVFKIVDDDMPSEVVMMESAAIQHAISAGISLNLPKIVKNIHKNMETGINIHKNERKRSRLIEFIEGDVLENITDISVVMLKNVGKSLAEFNLSLREFNHPAAHRSHRWNMIESAQHEATIQRISDPEKRAMLEWAFKSFGESESVLRSLPWQFIHGDPNRENILVAGDRVVGLVDFGDSCHNPTVCDLAICLTYLMMEQPDPTRIAAITIDGYRQLRPLSPLELSVLYSLICGRLAVSISVATVRKAIDPENPNWFTDLEGCWRLLRTLRELDRDRFLA